MPSFRWVRTDPSATTTFASSVRRVTVMMGRPTKPSFSICLSKASFPRTWKVPGISHSTSSVRHDRICPWSPVRKPSIYVSIVSLLSLMFDCVVSHDVVLECHRARLRIHPVPGELQLRPVRGVGQQPYASAQQHGNDGDLDRIHEAHPEQAPEEGPTTEQPDVLARRCLQLRHGVPGVRQHRYAGAVGLLQCARQDIRLHPGHGGSATLLPRRLVGLSTQQHRVERARQGREVDLRIHHDPVAFTVGAGNISVKGHRHRVANASHAISRSNTDAICAARRSATSSTETSRPNCRARLVTPRPVIPQGTISANGARSLVTFSANPCDVTQRAMRTPMAPIFSSPTQAPVMPGTRPAVTPKSAQPRIMTSSRSRT